MKSIYGLLTCAALPWLVNSAFADDLGYANLIINGTIVEESCSIAITSQNQNVHIGNFPANSFTSPGDVTTTKPFTILLNGCSNAISDATITFSGTADSASDDLLALSDTSGAGNMASGVAIQLLDKSMNAIAINSKTAVGALQKGDNTLQYYLRYKATAVPVKAGNASSVLYFDMSYQ